MLEVGWQQGNPMDPLLFSLGLQDVIDTITREVAESGEGLEMHAWYLDNGVFVGTTQ